MKKRTRLMIHLLVVVIVGCSIAAAMGGYYRPCYASICGGSLGTGGGGGGKK